MEDLILPHPAVAGILSEHFVEARLHTDLLEDEIVEPILELQDELVGNPTTPAYVLLDPATGLQKGLMEGATLDEDKFRDFLLQGLERAEEKVVRLDDER